MLVDQETVQKDVINLLLTKKQQESAPKHSILSANNKVAGTQNRELRTRAETRLQKDHSVSVPSANKNMDDIKNKF
jgi:hypothetical protein